MGGSARVPWPRLRDYLLQVSTCRSLDECMRTACVEMQKVIPFDATTGIFDASDNRSFAGFGRSDACMAEYNSHYHKLRPRTQGPIIDWHRYDGEFTEDFMFPNGMHKTLRRVVPGHSTWIAVLRSRRAPEFFDFELDSLVLIEDYLNSLFASFEKLRSPHEHQLSAERLTDRFGDLSPREAEVCSLVAARLNTAEMAARLFISRRTVERHVENIFQKLDVRSREQLRFRLGVLPY